jgi:hypothetical protein
MARIWFINPNEPEQPARGVYRWFYLSGRSAITFYVGNAGERRQGISSPSTLKRGVLEAQRSCLSSDRGQTLDTDFIVGTAIRYLKDKGVDCYWQHVSDDPSQESELCRSYAPVLQDGTDIRADFRLRKPDGGTGESEDVASAEKELYKKFEICFSQMP